MSVSVEELIAELESTGSQRVTTDEVRSIQMHGQRSTEMAIQTWGMMGRDRLREGGPDEGDRGAGGVAGAPWSPNVTPGWAAR